MDEQNNTYLTELSQWVDAGYFKDDNQLSAIKMMTEAENPNPIMVESIYNSFKKQVEDILRQKILEQEKEDKKKDLDKKYDEWIYDDNHPKHLQTTPMGGRKFFTYKKRSGEMVLTTNIPIKKGHQWFCDKLLNKLLTDYLNEKDKWVEGQLAEKPKKKTAGGSRQKVDCEEWIEVTEEEAKAKYDTEKGYALEVDVEKRAVWVDTKLYKAGQKDPRDNNVKLTEPLRKKTYKPCIRKTQHLDLADENRCRGAVIWKDGRYGSVFTKQMGIRGNCVIQCTHNKVGDNDYCSKCQKTQKDINEFIYKESTLGEDICAVEYLKKENIIELGE
jgi:hypothetical protein